MYYVTHVGPIEEKLDLITWTYKGIITYQITTSNILPSLLGHGMTNWEHGSWLERV